MKKLVLLSILALSLSAYGQNDRVEVTMPTKYIGCHTVTQFDSTSVFMEGQYAERKIQRRPKRKARDS